MSTRSLITSVAALAFLAGTPGAWAQDDAPPTIEDARAFVEAAEQELAELSEKVGRIYWIYSNFITYDTMRLRQDAAAQSTLVRVRLANATKAYEGLDLPEDVARKMDRLRLSLTLPAPERQGAPSELAELTTRLSSTYSTGHVTLDGEEKPLVALEKAMGEVRDLDQLEAMWTGWREVSPPMAEDYARLVEIANEGARELGFSDVGEMWLSNYDMTAEEMEGEVERLWSEVKPLYDQLHCHVRAELNETYGDEAVPLDQPIRADVLGNMWAQTWGNIADLVASETSGATYNLTELLGQQGYDAHRMVETGETFLTSLGFEPLPQTFWERSLITKPADREVVCHASAWDIDDEEDIRIKMCTQVTADDFSTVHHELGHNIYQRAYRGQDWIYRDGAHDGFHEAIGDFIALSITPEYLTQIELLPADQLPDASADITLLMNQAMNKIAFLPFGYLMDQWRWKVFSGEITPEEYNDAWWELRESIQGVRAPVERPADAFDPGAKYHIPNNVPYLRYFLSYVMQFQLHEAACNMMDWDGPLHRCSIYGSQEVGARFNAMMEMGASQEWPNALEAFAGTREMSGESIISYFAPLMTWLEEQNENRQCGW